MRQLLSILLLIFHVDGMKLTRPWSTQQWCSSVVNPHWPFVYSKSMSEVFEGKGRVASNEQNMGHSCDIHGASDKCYICEEIMCDISSPNIGMCNYQLQGINYNSLPSNIPSVSDAPFAINGAHRYDFGGGSHVCVIQSGGSCVTHNATDYSNCKVRCWGYNYPVPVPFSDSWTFEDSVRWTYSKNIGNPQGKVSTLAGGGGSSGFQDGTGKNALFNNPQDVAIDRSRNVYVADTDNHAIRKVTPSGVVTTIAGTGYNTPFTDGPALTATFSFPKSLALYYDSNNNLVIIIADTDNHKIRKLTLNVVSTLSGLKGNIPQSGFGDGAPEFARFNSPSGVAADNSGTVYVSDRDNHVIRQVNTDGTTTTLAGTLVQDSSIPGCTEPCYRGVAGFSDGELLSAMFDAPSDIAIGLDGTLVVTDDDRVRRVDYRNSINTIQGVISQNRVTTISGGLNNGYTDGYGNEASFSNPQGVMMASDGRIYVADSSNCRIRQISSAFQTAVPITCSATAVDVIRPSGCFSYDPPVGAYEFLVSQAAGNIYYNYNQTTNVELDGEYIALGRSIKDCQGTPPFDTGVEFTGATAGPHNGTIAASFTYKEDTDDSTAIKVYCPSGCGALAVAANNGFSVWGSNNIYTDYSKICLAALHAGAMTDAGGLLVVTLQRGASSYTGTTGQNSVVSRSLSTPWYRSYSVVEYKLALVEVQTIAGPPAASLDDVCGYNDAQPPLEAQFFIPSGIATFINASLTGTELLYIADTQNHAIRTINAVCSQTCENGGNCTAPELCLCAAGWTGTDCTIPICSTPCSGRTLCTAPNTCSCIPGYTGIPSCNTPTCVQTCHHGGVCTSPDTCSCNFGWFDANCTTPVCSQTCGNGANCTAPNTCSCPSQWMGVDCRTPVCSQTCRNGGLCIAPNTCMCPHNWSGFDCSWPIAHQGFLQIDRSLPLRPTYYPCSVEQWCESTNDFDCQQVNRTGNLLNIQWGGPNRQITGFKQNPGPCAYLELTINADTYFQYETSTNTITSYYYHTPNTPYQWNGGNPWSSSTAALPDRQVALAELRMIPQGTYVCANNGAVPVPDICDCSPTWVGFDCRIPVCYQGYFEYGADNRQPLWGSQFSVWEGAAGGQGGYECSIRAMTPWERYQCSISTHTCTEYICNHPNFYTRYMDGVQSVLAEYDIWAPLCVPPQCPVAQTYGWPALESHNQISGDDTNEGWRRPGWWTRTTADWEKGLCITDYERICINDTAKVSQYWSIPDNTITNNTFNTYKPIISYTNTRTTASGRWFTQGGECIDNVLRGCYNNGTCVAPNTCKCAPGWSGYNCMIPVCLQTCFNNGNCTLPDICTCEKGWSGFDCSIPLCAQTCANNGTCVAPDTCLCKTWPNTFYDKRIAGGRPLFQQSNGDPQLTGWTGYDCSTPICTQAKTFVLNDIAGSVRLGGYGKILYGDPPTNNLYGQPPPPPYTYTETLVPGDGQVTRNDGHSFQSGCLKTSPRYSPTFLCGVVVWNQGDYIAGRYSRVNNNTIFIQSSTDSSSWYQPSLVPGEGIFECYNHGSCIAPDTCTCPDGWTGYDCSFPLCRHQQPATYPNGSHVIVSCLNGGVCASKDNCVCPQTESLLSIVHPDLLWENPGFLTGYNGSDCSIPMCVQGWFDPNCDGVAPGGEGCFRCANGGNCTAPDFCTCAEGWTGFDCRTPICYYGVHSLKTINELNTVDPIKIIAFENDPCQNKKQIMFQNVLHGQGNCTQPNICQCLCTSLAPYDKNGQLVEEPWKDSLGRALPAGTIFGDKDCLDGWQGGITAKGYFVTCHLKIKVPTWLERYSVTLIGVSVTFIILASVVYYNVRKYLKKKRLLEKIEKRRSRRSEERESREEQAGAFQNK